MSVQSVALPKTGPVRTWILGGIAALLAAIAFHGALFELVRRWTTQEEYSHGFLIPLVAAWLLWTRRDVLLASFGPPSWAGVLLILLAMIMHMWWVLERNLHSFPVGLHRRPARNCACGRRLSSAPRRFSFRSYS